MPLSSQVANIQRNTEFQGAWHNNQDGHPKLQRTVADLLVDDLTDQGDPAQRFDDRFEADPVFPFVCPGSNG